MGEDTRACPDCGGTIKAEAILCRHCHYDLKAGRPAPRGDAPSPPRAKSSAPVIFIVLAVAAVGGIGMIAIIAAIAIPGLLASQRASNERNASASLKTLAAAEADFRANDRDGNAANEFWTGDVAGLYCMSDASIQGRRDPIMLIEISVAGADAAPLASGALGGQYLGMDNFAVRAPKAGYQYLALRQNADGKPYHSGSFRHPSEFAFCAFPANSSSGKSVFLISEWNSILKRRGDLSPVARFPTDDELRMGWSKLD
jgi:hypothetical protein